MLRRALVLPVANSSTVTQKQESFVPTVVMWLAEPSRGRKKLSDQGKPKNVAAAKQFLNASTRPKKRRVHRNVPKN